jgi:hypothetical protein
MSELNEFNEFNPYHDNFYNNENMIKIKLDLATLPEIILRDKFYQLAKDRPRETYNWPKDLTAIPIGLIPEYCTELIMEHYVENNVNGVDTEVLIKELLK